MPASNVSLTPAGGRKLRESAPYGKHRGDRDPRQPACSREGGTSSDRGDSLGTVRPDDGFAYAKGLMARRDVVDLIFAQFDEALPPGLKPERR